MNESEVPASSTDEPLVDPFHTPEAEPDAEPDATPTPADAPAPEGLLPGRADALTVVALLVFGLVARLCTTPMIESGGDAVRAWFNAKQLYLGVTDRFWEWDHHSIRFALIVPTWIVQEVLGTRPLVYYVTPFAMTLLAMGLVYAIGRRLGRPGAGFGAAVAFALFPQMERAGAQLLGEVFSAAYVLLGVYFLLRYRDSKTRRAAWALAIAGALFLAYMTKITNVLFFPGFALGLWLFGRSVRDLALVFGVLLALFCAETLLYRTLTEHSLGQLSIISGGHLKDRRLEPTPFAEFFTHFGTLSASWQVVLVAFVVATGIALARARQMRVVAALAAIPLSFLLLQNFAVKSLDPLIPVQRFLPRYMLPALPMALLVAALVIASLADRHMRARPPWLRQAAAALLMVGASLWLLVARFPGVDAHAFSVLSGYERTANAAFADGVPIVDLDSQKQPAFFVRILWSGLTGDTFTGELPPVRKVKHGRKSAWYVIEPGRAPSRGRRSSQKLFDGWIGREVVLTSPKRAKGRDMGSLFTMKVGPLR